MAGRDDEPDDTQHMNYDRRGWRSAGSDYYGNDPRRYGNEKRDPANNRERGRFFNDGLRNSYGGDSDAHSHYYGRGPRNFRRSDARIREMLCEALTEDPLIDASNIEVIVDNTEVTLTGDVLTRDERHLAEDLAHRIPDVTLVHNSLRILGMRNGSSFESPRDESEWLRD